MQHKVISRIIGTGSFFPHRIVGNAEVAAPLHLDEEEIFHVTGIRSRRWASQEETCSYFAEQAARRALAQAGIESTAVQAIFVSTTSPDAVFPSTACYVQQRLGATGAFAFDVAASCSGFLYALSMADRMIRANQIRQCLVVASEIKSRYLNRLNKSSTILFGDGAGAVVLRGEAQSASCIKPTGILGIRLYADGAYHGLIAIPAGGSRIRASLDTLQHDLHTIQLQGHAVFRIGVKRLSRAMRELLEEFHLQVTDVQQVITHQANGRMLAAIRERLKLPEDRVVSILEDYGNTSSASLPIALDYAVRRGLVHADDVILLGAFGGGFTWATALIRW
ncbi:MAG: beta-ketoacyl-ACP synthase III [Nitrospirae bacterium]|nr:MAG: beta-ketoacyl-ACP synthase III [Nitrospirota bacterium]